MARERESFRDQLQSLQAKFPEQEVLTKDQACKLLGLDWHGGWLHGSAERRKRQWTRNARICTKGQG